jgi:hypothetical protein
VEEWLDGSGRVTYNRQDLRCREISKKPIEGIPESPLRLRERRPWTPPADHPWKTLFLSKKKKRVLSIVAP